MAVSMFSNSMVLVSWCRGRRRLKRRRGSTIRLGYKAKCRGFWLGSRPVVRWSVMVGPLKMLKKIISEITVQEKFIETYYMYLPCLRPQLFPLC
ncbi:ubiquinone biosynthesis monooxygenase COQ6-like [Hibiscus syriacus]|uniref:Ubiquinone biosynthesis monooxygenase COQ6-like n=1 Tax=Hibiscus syriacus TaxID=106335 RepID=A0A6A2ZTP4_HIBSY|nr:ubiquinone biosynthesis monooxygenase COQ6-like [Hibiscus syriacus]